ncbi:hypothetical protein [Campylobacter jejuni]|uniref:hypothetical protein n=1 Tax=Campylobacter jejuni TaxID=197 RepID=UPI000F80DBC9|nr:hypothetical protein [Campylobacter jejuni]RTH89695.1 hypothetical protein C3I33_08090 [Campylobacter jejuni]RTH92117.1 hypothetical protein C3I35_08795 [Campylobacter jejuni]
MLNIYDVLFSSLPILLIGAVIGTVQFLHIDKAAKSKTNFLTRFKLFIKTSSTSGVLALSSFLITDNFDLTYSSRIGVSIFIAFAGYEKIQSIIDRLLDNISPKDKDSKL